MLWQWKSFLLAFYSVAYINLFFSNILCSFVNYSLLKIILLLSLSSLLHDHYVLTISVLLALHTNYVVLIQLQIGFVVPCDRK